MKNRYEEGVNMYIIKEVWIEVNLKQHANKID